MIGLRNGGRRLPDELGWTTHGHDAAALGAEETIGRRRGYCGVDRETECQWLCTQTGRRSTSKRRPSSNYCAGEAAMTQFGRMCDRLGIRITRPIPRRPKGRVERNHGTHQDRL